MENKPDLKPDLLMHCGSDLEPMTQHAYLLKHPNLHISCQKKKNRRVCRQGAILDAYRVVHFGHRIRLRVSESHL